MGRYQDWCSARDKVGALVIHHNDKRSLCARVWKLIWKYVGCITISECVDKNSSSNIHGVVDLLSIKSRANKFKLNESKCKELNICFSKTNRNFNPVRVNNVSMEWVENTKLIGVTISSNLKWNAHVSSIVRKISSRLYFLRQLRRASIANKDLLLFYITYIRPITKYTCQLFHNSRPKYLSDDLERLQKRAMRVVFGPGLNYAETLKDVG